MKGPKALGTILVNPSSSLPTKSGGVVIMHRVTSTKFIHFLKAQTPLRY